ncbi:MAG: LacI family DNA-binding transcriptional regulator [Opitutaceae bacterium]
MSKARVTLADVARRAGVHPTTVSVALRDSPRIPEKTRVRLKLIAEEMGYVPDPGARALAGYRGNTNAPRSVIPIGYITNWHTRWGWKEVTAHPDFFEGASQRAAELGLSIEHFWLREPGLTHGRLSQILDSRGITGIIIASHVREIDEELQFAWERFSAVKIDYFPHFPELAMVTSDQMNAVRIAVQRALAAGYRRIGFVMDDGYDITVDRLWSAGFVWEQQAIHPADRIPAYMIPGNAPLNEWIREHRPDVIIGKAEWVLPTLNGMGLAVPRDMSFIDVFLEDATGELAGVRQNHCSVGAAAVDILSGLIRHNSRGIPEIPIRTLIEGTWVDGRSLPGRHAVSRTR